jgi:hypothetical protein
VSSPEIQPRGEVSIESSSEAAAEQLEKLRNRQEKGGEQGPDTEARVSAERKKVEAILGKEKPVAETVIGEKSRASRTVISQKDKKISFNQTMKQVQSELSPTERVFSRVIHNPIVEKVSDVAAKTVARPNAILAGGLSAFILVLLAYFLARNYGFRLSGFETIGAFVLGWIIGIIFDYVRVMVSGKHSR